jgi:hypothetical protein
MTARLSGGTSSEAGCSVGGTLCVSPCASTRGTWGGAPADDGDAGDDADCAAARARTAATRESGKGYSTTTTSPLCRRKEAARPLAWVSAS